ncbi:17499_t:CDS:2, partial [Entrophospora sp. SA101]
STDEIKQMLNHRLTSRDAAEGLVRRIFVWNCVLFCPRGGERFLIKIDQYQFRNNMLIFTKFHQKNDQGGLSGSSDCLEIPCPCDEPALDTNKSTDINEINNQAVNNKNAVIIDLKDSYELPKENDVSTSKITQVIEGSSMDLNSEIINKLNINNDKLIDNSNSNCSKRMG